MKLSNNESNIQEKTSCLEFYFLTLFPEVFSPVLSSSLLGKAHEKGLVNFHLIQLRNFATDKHRTVDDTPYGGGEGMVLKVDVLYNAWKKVKDLSLETKAESIMSSLSSSEPESGISTKTSQKILTILMSPQGRQFNRDMALELSEYDKLIFVCGHYEGVDERFISLCVDREVSIGDYVLTGGELPALVMADAITRRIPGVVGKARSITEDSLERGRLKYPQYTRPREFNGLKVPDVLLSGDHKAIASWRDTQMLERTKQKRPDLGKA